MTNIAYTTPSIDTGRYFANVTPETTAFEATSEVVAMAVCENTMWLVLLDGSIEVRDVHAGHVVHHFPPSHSHRVRSILAVTCAITGQTQMWLGLLSGTIDVYSTAGSRRKSTAAAARYPLLRQLRKHLSCVYCMAESEGRCVFSGSSDFYIAQWRVRDGQLLRVLSGHTNYVRCLLAERAALISGSDDGTVRVWDVDTGATLHVGTFHQRVIAAENGGKMAESAAGAKESPIRRRSVLRDRTNTNTGGLVGKAGSSHGSNIHNNNNGEASSPSLNGVSALCRVGMTIWSGDDSGGLVVWRLQDGATLLASRPHAARITAITKVGSRVYTASGDGAVGLHNALDGTLVQMLRQHGNTRVQALACAVEVDRYFVWTGAADNTIRCWHHDEHIPMTREREAFNDMRWYYATKRPFAEANHQLLEEQQELNELALLANGSNEAVKSFLQDTDTNKQTAAMQYYTMEGKLKEMHQAISSSEEQRRTVEQTLQSKKDALAAARQSLQQTLEAVQAARSQQYQYGGGAYGMLQSSPPSYSTAPAPPPPTSMQQLFGGYVPASSSTTLPPPSPAQQQQQLPVAGSSTSAPIPAASTTVLPAALPLSTVHIPTTTTTTTTADTSNPLGLSTPLSNPLALPTSATAAPSPVSLPPPPLPRPSVLVPFIPVLSTGTIVNKRLSAGDDEPLHVARSTSFEPELSGPPPPPSIAVSHEAPVVYGVTQKISVPASTSHASVSPKAPLTLERRGSFKEERKPSLGKRRCSF